MTGFGIRQATEADREAVTALLQVSYATLMPAGYEPALLEKVLSFIARANPFLLSCGTYYLAEMPRGDLIGAGGWTPDQPGSGALIPSTGHIRHFACHPDWTGHGVGRALFDRCLAAAKASGMTRFECYTSLNAVDFYRKLGFKKRQQVDIPMGPKGEGQGTSIIMPALLMERSI